MNSKQHVARRPARIVAGVAAFLAFSTLAFADASKPELGQWGVDLEAIDHSVKPGDDFYRYVNGIWLETFQIPADFTNYGAFTVLFERSESRVRDIIQSAAGDGANSNAVQNRIGDFYAAYVNVEEIQDRGLAPARADLDRLGSIASLDDIARAFGEPRLAATSPFGAYVYVDAKQTDRYLVHITQSGLGLPDRDYYLEGDFAEIRDAYLAFIAQMLDLAGIEEAAGKAAAILELETGIAERHWPLAKTRDPNLTYNLMSKSQLLGYAPGFPWQLAFDAAGIGSQNEFILNEADALQSLAALFAETPVATWAAYLQFHYLVDRAGILPVAFDEANFAFFGKTLTGQPEQRERWKRGVAAVNAAMGEAVGQIYVERYFPPRSKAMMEDLIRNLRRSLAQRIDQLDWMSPATKREAQEKLSKFRAYVGYPDEWRDYSGLVVRSDDALGNHNRSNEFEWAYFAARLGKPVEPGKEWGMTPQTVNAYYSPPRNAIYFPAAILQPPFFDPNADPAVNYGGIGTVIGHEIGHGFDDQGRKQDGDGLLRDWWTVDDTRRFEERTAVLGEQYGGYSPIDGLFINPELTMGENVGDLGGVAVSYFAYQLSLNGETPPVLDGYTGDQRFFLAYGQVWRRKYRDAELRNRLVIDPHSPSEYRVNGIVRNLNPWYQAFDVKTGQALYLAPGQRVTIW